MRRPGRPWVVVVGLLGGAVASLAAQSSRVGGVLLRPVGSDAVAVPGARVVLHQVGRATQGPIDTVATNARGEFTFRFRADTTANYLVSARYAGIEYFSNPVATNPARPDTALKLLVYDTASTAPVKVKSRTLVVSAPDAIGTRTVIDWLVLENPSRTTRVGSDSLAPTWGTVLATSARNPQVGDARLSQFSPDALQFRAESVYVTAPIAPGEKELLLQYELPAEQHRLEISLAQVDSVDLFLEESAIKPPSTGWVVSDSQAFEGRRFRRMTRRSVTERAVSLKFPGFAAKPDQILTWLVATFALVLMVGAYLLRRR